MKSGMTLIVIASFVLLPALVLGQSYQGVSHLLVTGGVSMPSGGLSDFWNAGPQGRLTVRFPLTSSISAGLQGGITGLRPDDDNSELIQVPLRAMAYFPLAPEASGTPYLAVGVGATINMFGCKDKEVTCYLDKTETFFAYTAMFGYTIRPEAMANAFFDFGVRYEQQLINDREDYRNLDLEIGIGLCF